MPLWEYTTTMTQRLGMPETGIIKSELEMLDIQYLQKLVFEVKPPNCYLEIGTREGGSALFARLANKDIEIHAIDPKPILDGWQFHPREFGINIIVGTSLSEAKKWNKPIGVLLIDGNHVRAHGDMAKEDFYAWEKFIVKGGYVLIHDYSPGDLWKDVVKDCDEIIKESNYKLIFKPNLKEPMRFPSTKSTAYTTSLVILQK